MANVDFELNLAGLNELMKSAEMQSVLKQAGNAAVAIAGADYGTETRVLTFSAIQNVFPNSKEAAKDNALHNTCVKAVGATGLKMEE